MLTFLPFTFVPESLAVWIMVWISLLSAYYIVRKLGLPTWWLLFPPLVEGVYVANPQIALLALLLSGVSGLAAIAPMLKIYAFAPLVGNLWIRALAVAVAYLAISIVVAPSLWLSYLGRADEIAARLMLESDKSRILSYGHSPALVIAGIVGLGLLAIVDLPAAGWLASPALVPASQFPHLSTMAMPVLASPHMITLTVLLAIPVKGLPTVAIAVYGFWRFYAAIRAKRLSSQARPRAPT